MKNSLEVVRGDFILAFEPMRRCRPDSTALMAFEGGFLSIGVDDCAAVMRARGAWHVRATFSSGVVRALAKAPPSEDPIHIELEGDRLRISSLQIKCAAEPVSAAFVRAAVEPDYLDLLAMDKTLSRSEVATPPLKRKISVARSTLAGRVQKAAKLLAVADISEGDLWKLVEQNVRARIENGQK